MCVYKKSRLPLCRRLARHEAQPIPSSPLALSSADPSGFATKCPNRLHIRHARRSRSLAANGCGCAALASSAVLLVLS